MGKSNGTIELEVPVKFGGVSIGDATTRIGVKIDRDCLRLNEADRIFCGHRLTGRVELGNGGDSNGQTRFVSVEKLEGIFDCKRLGFDAGTISTGLTFNKKDIDMDLISKFAKGSGRMFVMKIEEIPDDAPDHDENAPSLPGTFKADGPWADVMLSTLFDGAILKSFTNAKIKTVGDMAAFTSKENQNLGDITGLGPVKVELIEKRMVEFHRDNPEAAEEKPGKKPELTLGKK